MGTLIVCLTLIALFAVMCAIAERIQVKRVGGITFIRFGNHGATYFRHRK